MVVKEDNQVVIEESSVVVTNDNKGGQGKYASDIRKTIKIPGRVLDDLRSVDIPEDSVHSRISYLIGFYRKHTSKQVPEKQEQSVPTEHIEPKLENKEVGPGQGFPVELQCPKPDCLKYTIVGARADKQICEHCGYDFKSSV